MEEMVSVKGVIKYGRARQTVWDVDDFLFWSHDPELHREVRQSEVRKRNRQESEI